MRVKIVFKYDGSKFNGFQRLNNCRSVQGEIENVLSTIYQQEIVIKGSGRTDAKVHANNQVAHFDVEEIKPNLIKLLNLNLNPDIVIKSLRVVSDNFHARMSVKKKEYIYRINLGLFQSSLNDYYYQPRFKLDIKLMKQASKYLLGTHDFRNFVSGERDDYFTTIYDIKFIRHFNHLDIYFVGAGFYRYMVRNLVGALIDVGRCKESAISIKNMVENPFVEKRLLTAPPEGLYLNKIWY